MQILCRSLGSSNFIQPHAFLPPEFAGNERARCGVGSLAPMVLNPWSERDPFHKEADFPSFILPQHENEVFSSQRPTPFDTSTTTKAPKPIPVLTDRLDFEPPLLITARPKPSTNKTPTTLFNKVEFPSTTFRPKTTTTNPKKKRTTTVRVPSSTIIDNKLDFGEVATTKRPDSPFSKQSPPNSTTIVKSKPNKKRKKPRSIPDSAFPESTETNLTTTTTTETNFTNQDNATEYLNNKPASRLGDFFESRADETDGRYGGEFDNDYEYGDRQPYRPSYDYSRPSSFYPPYPPLSQSSITNRPSAFQNHRPNFANTNYIHMRLPSTRPTRSPISNKHSTPFSYDSYQSPSSTQFGTQFGYENAAVPLYVSPNRVSNRPAYPSVFRPTTRRMDLSTFMIVETTRRTTPNTFFDFKRTTQRPYSIYHLSHSTKSPSLVILPSYAISSSSADDPNISLFASNTNHIYMKDPIGKPVSPFSYDKNEDVTYSRPQTNIFVPLKTKNPTYNDYSNYNRKPEVSKPNNVKFYYVGNVLHKYFKSNEDGTDDVSIEGLYNREETKRYAEGYEEHLSDRRTDQTVEDETEKTDETTVTKTLTFSGRARKGPQNIFIVPFKLLTRVERPDNWVNTEDVDDENIKSRLPEVPTLKQDNDVTKELPRPISTRPGSRN